LYNKVTQDNQFLRIINATVSHDLRNPLNAIIMTNVGTKFNHKLVRQIMADMAKDVSKGHKILLKYSIKLE